ncbi:MAG: hypothetical protein ABL971_01665 [Vicinamibacterales bacterium]
MWVEFQTIGTLLAFLAAAWYAVLTRRLLRETSAQRQTDLALRLMEEYDALRAAIQNVQEWHLESAAAGVNAVERFREALELDFATDDSKLVDDSRFKVSRFFVKVRKLSLAGFLDRRLIAAALSRAAVEDVFLGLIDPLDQVVSCRHYGRPNITDRDFYRDLAKMYP